MYSPVEFQHDELAALHHLMRQHAFATLISVAEGTPVITHLPFILDPTRGTQGTLYTHMARANPQWKSFSENCECWVIFQGPHHYISPNWYDDTVTSVPTWNYTAVHAQGVPRIIDEHEEFLALLNTSISEFESRFDKPWQLQLGEQPLKNLMRAIVGLEIPITRLQGKFKLSQNRPLTDQVNIIEQLRQLSHSDAEAIADLMETRIFTG